MSIKVSLKERKSHVIQFHIKKKVWNWLAKEARRELIQMTPHQLARFYIEERFLKAQKKKEATGETI